MMRFSIAGIVVIALLSVAAAQYYQVPVTLNDDEVDLFSHLNAPSSFADSELDKAELSLANVGTVKTSSSKTANPAGNAYGQQKTSTSSNLQGIQSSNKGGSVQTGTSNLGSIVSTSSVGQGNPVTVDGVFYAVKGPLELTGTNQVMIGDEKLPNPASAYTWMMWITPRSRVSDWSVIAQKGEKQEHRTFGIWLYPSSTRLHIRVSTRTNFNEGFDPQKVLPLEERSHLVLTVNGRTFRVYINGVLAGEVRLNDDVLFNSGPIYLGRNPWFGGSKVRVENFKIFDRELSQVEIARDYDNGICANDCSNNGKCVKGKCVCNPGFEGNDCSRAASLPIAGPQIPQGPGCPNNCNENGDCINNKCYCYSGFAGRACDFELPCPAACSGHGECRSGVCFCRKGWEGEDCSSGSTFNTTGGGPSQVVQELAYEKVKSFLYKYRGDANPAEDLVVAYLEPFFKKKIDMLSLEKDIIAGRGPVFMQCPRNCSGHGRCNFGECQCDKDWDGEDCGMKVCKNRCTGHGKCVNGKCICESGFDGDDCSIVTCKNDCSKHGFCANGVCQCDAGYTGDDCSQLVSIGSADRPAVSCQEVFRDRGSQAQNGVFFIRPSEKAEVFQAFCDFTTYGGGWTLLVKAPSTREDNAFKYDSNLWTTPNPYHKDKFEFDTAGFKSAGYASMPFSEILVGMKTGSTMKYATISEKSSSLLNLFRDGQFRATRNGRAWWKSLLPSPSLQQYCNTEGINVRSSRVQCRLGLLAASNQDCNLANSAIGIGCSISGSTVNVGNFCSGNCDGTSVSLGYNQSPTSNRDSHAVGYIFVR